MSELIGHIVKYLETIFEEKIHINNLVVVNDLMKDC